MSGFNNSFEKAFNPGMALGANAALETMKEKIKKDAEKAKETIKVTNNLTMAQELAKESDQQTQELLAKLIGDDTKSWDADSSDSLVKLAIQRNKDKTDFQQTIQAEKYKAGVGAVTEVVKTLAERGGMTPEELQQIQMQSSDRVASALGLNPVENNIAKFASQQGGQAPAQVEQTSNFFTKPIEPKKTDKEKEYEATEQRGLEILDQTEAMYNDISKKYGTGRLKGVATQIRGGLGDLIPGSERAPEVVPYQNNLEGLANFIGKTVYRDERVSDVNLKGYKKALAELTNTPEEAKIMFSTLRSFAGKKDPKALEALRLMIPNSGKGGMKPSEAIKKVQGGKSAQEEADAYLNS